MSGVSRIDDIYHFLYNVMSCTFKVLYIVLSFNFMDIHDNDYHQGGTAAKYKRYSHI